MDIAPALLEQIQKEYTRRVSADPIVKQLNKALASNRATQPQIRDYAVRLGENLNASFRSVLKESALPDGKLYYNIADRTITPMLRELHTDALEYADLVQTSLNAKAKLGIGVVDPDFNIDRAKGLVDAVSGRTASEAAVYLGEPVTNFAENVIDDWVHKNADALYNAGFTPKIIRQTAPAETRTTYSKPPREYEIPCEWCMGLEGEYEYSSVSNTGNDVFRRHVGCRCEIVYISPMRAERVNDHTPLKDVNEIAKRINHNTGITRM